LNVFKTNVDPLGKGVKNKIEHVQVVAIERVILIAERIACAGARFFAADCIVPTLAECARTGTLFVGTPLRL